MTGPHANDETLLTLRMSQLKEPQIVRQALNSTRQASIANAISQSKVGLRREADLEEDEAIVGRSGQ